MKSLKKFLILAVVIYIISPLDLLPGCSIDDILVSLVTLASAIAIPTE